MVGQQINRFIRVNFEGIMLALRRNGCYRRQLIEYSFRGGEIGVPCTQRSRRANDFPATHLNPMEQSPRDVGPGMETNENEEDWNRDTLVFNPVLRAELR